MKRSLPLFTFGEKTFNTLTIAYIFCVRIYVIRFFGSLSFKKLFQFWISAINRLLSTSITEPTKTTLCLVNKNLQRKSITMAQVFGSMNKLNGLQHLSGLYLSFCFLYSCFSNAYPGIFPFPWGFSPPYPPPPNIFPRKILILDQSWILR